MTVFWCNGKNGVCDDNDKCRERGCEFFNGEGGRRIDIKTNADRIRAMSDEELAVEIYRGISSDSCDYCKHGNGYCDGTPCDGKEDVEIIIDWLKQPVKDGDDE